MTAAPAVVAATSEGDARALLIRKLRKEYRPGVPVLKDIDLAIPGRGMTAVIGPSGTGKSTLIRCNNRLVEPTAGEILFRAKILPSSPVWRCARHGGASGWCSRSTTSSSA